MAKNSVKIKIHGKTRTAKLGLAFMRKAISEELPKDDNILNISTDKLLYHALAMDDIANDREVEFNHIRVCDYIDTVGLFSDEVKAFQKAFFESMEVHMPDDKSKKAMRDIVKQMTKEEQKKSS